MKRPQKNPIKEPNPITTSDNAKTIVRTKREITMTFAPITFIDGTLTQGRIFSLRGVSCAEVTRLNVLKET